MSLADVREHAQTCDVPGLVEALTAVAQSEGFWGNQLNELKKVVSLGRLPCRIEVAAALAERLPHVHDDNAHTLLEYVLNDLVDAYGPKLDVEQAHTVLKIAAGSWWFFPGDRLAELGKTVLEDGGVLGGDVVAAMRRTAIGPPSDKELKAFVANIEQPIFNPGEPWADHALGDLCTFGNGWNELAAHAVTAAQAEPSAEWQEQGRRLLAAVGERQARDVITGWLALLGKPRTLALSPRGYLVDVEYTPDPYNAIALRGLVWLLGLLSGDAALARLLAGLVETNMRKVPGVGPRNPKVAGGAIYALSRLDAEEAGAELSRLATRITQKDTVKQLQAALETRAAARRLSRDELVEVPSYGLTQVGQRSELLGEDTATLRIDGDGQVAIQWRNAAGTVLQSAPTAVKNQFPERLKELKAVSKDIARALATQAERLDCEFLAQRGWLWPAWRAQYLDHVLLGTLTRRLLWIVGDRPCGFADGCLRTLDGSPLHPADSEKVSLWHPVGRPAEEVLAWREWLRHHDIVQPFEQAERQVYAPAEAERERFAGRLLHPQRLQKLATARGWEQQQPGVTRDLPAWGLHAALEINGRTSGLLHFYPLQQTGQRRELALLRGLGWQPEPKPLEQIPPLVFGEVIRDLELVLK